MIYICGDSFAYPDPEYGPNWADLLAQRLPVVNSSRVCASNVQIASQVDWAIAQDADYIIYMATSSVRQDVQLKQPKLGALHTRWCDITDPGKEQDIVSYSVNSLDSTTLFNATQLSLLRHYTLEFFNLDVAIYQNELIIEGTLARLSRSGIPYSFSQGGFELGRSCFDNYTHSEINLWTQVNNKSFRPYYHITDSAVHQRTADYYYSLINDKT